MKIHKRSLNIFLLAISLALVILSIAFPQQEVNPVGEAARLERKIDNRLSLLDRYGEKILNESSEYLFKTSDIPEDFIFYRYENTHLSAWHGQLPVQYDEYLTAGRHTTLSSVRENYRFYNFSGDSYLLRSFQNRDIKLIAGIKINGNKHLGLDNNYSLRPISYGDGVVVNVRNEPVMRIVYDSLPVKSAFPAYATWLAYLLFIGAVLLALYGHPTLKNAIATSCLLLFFAIAIYKNYPVLYGELTQILSIVMVALAFFIIATSLYICRVDLWRKFKSRISMFLGSAVVFLISVALIWFAYISIYKIEVYTHITLDLYKIWALDWNSLIAYITLLLIFFTVAEFSELLQPLWIKLARKRFSLFSANGMLIYSLFVGIFCIGLTTYISYQRERIVVASWAESLSNARDYGLESHLRRVERQISKDEVVASALNGENGVRAARTRIMDKYLSKYLNVYDVKVEVGRDGRLFSLEDGVQIESGSRFLYAPLSDQRSRYIAAFHYYHSDKGQETVYVILEPKYPDNRSLSMILGSRENSSIPSRYSYALYKDKYRQYFRGNFPYPIKLTDELQHEFSKNGEYVFRKNGYLNFVVPVGNNEVIVMSRPYGGVGTQIILCIFLSLVFYFLMSPLAHKKRRPLLFEKNYFKRRMNTIMLISLLVTMSFLAFVSVSFVYDRNTFISERMMSEKVNSIRFQLQSGMRGVVFQSELTSRETLDLLRRVGDNTGSDISLYRADGKIALSTAPELYERHILWYRMPEEAYYHLRYKNEGFCIHKETLGKRHIYMLYAPIVGASGDVVAYLSSPYTDNGRDFQFDALMHAFNVLVVFIILMILSTMLVSYFIDKTFKPLSAMSRVMRSGKLEKLEDLGYKKDDEIMDIVNSYNRMVDDLRGNAKALAQAERDKAWSEMARNVAHEIKNPLTPMQLQIQRVQRLKAAGDPSWQAKFDDMANVLLDHIHILTETANQFSDFAKLYSEEPVEVPLDDLLREEVSLYDNRPGVDFTYLGLPGVVVNAPRPQLVRVFVNLLNNAVQACEDRPNARVEVSLRNGSSDGYYEIVFEDNGPGVDEKNIEKLFTPKFTTKSSGSGLGLSICRSILERCGASITYSRSFRLGGACFTILYPKKPF